MMAMLAIIEQGLTRALYFRSPFVRLGWVGAVLSTKLIGFEAYYCSVTLYFQSRKTAIAARLREQF